MDRITAKQYFPGLNVPDTFMALWWLQKGYKCMATSRLLKYFASIKNITMNALLNMGSDVTGSTVFVRIRAEQRPTFHAIETQSNITGLTLLSGEPYRPSI
jgi:hypothetical protein